MNTVTVVGASLAGLYAARELRAQGFDGRLVIVGAEPHLPYDRPPLSKDFLTSDAPLTATTPGTADAAPGTGAPASAIRDPAPGPADPASATRGPAPGTADPAFATGDPESGTVAADSTLALGDSLVLTDSEEIGELAAEWLLGVHATGLDQHGRAVLLDDGRAVVTDGVVVATGASARRLPGSRPAGVHTLRTLDDARALRADLVRGPRRVVVIGGGFIGAETAASCVALGHEVTVVESASLPLLPQLGPDMAAFCADLHRRGGARLLTGTGVAGLHQSRGVGRVTAVALSDGRVLPADVVVVGIGATPNTAWLEGTSLALRDGVLCDDGCATPLPHVVAAGDVARVGGVRAEHWTSATEQPRVAVRNLLAGRTVESVTGQPYFWSDQYGCRIQFAGHRPADAAVRIVEGDPDEGSFLAVYEHAGRMTAALAVNRPRPFMKMRRELRARQPTAV